MHAGWFSSSVTHKYCSRGLRVGTMFHVEAGLCRSLLWGITGMGRPDTYLPGTFPTMTGKCFGEYEG